MICAASASPPPLHPIPGTSPSPEAASRRSLAAVTVAEIKQLQADLIKKDLFRKHQSQNHLISLCFAAQKHRSAGALDHALLLFDRCPRPTCFMRNTVIKCLAETHTPHRAILFYATAHEAGIPPNHHTFPVLLKACSRLLALDEGSQINAHLFKTGLEADVHVRNALIHLYCSCGAVDDARNLFDRMPERDIVTWNAMIMGCSQNGLSEEALHLFRELQAGGPRPDEITMVAVLSACADAGALELGKWAHAYIRKHKMDGRISVNTALIDMYSKCGCVDAALEVFSGTPNRTIVCWTAMISGLAINGCGRKAMELFDQMVADDVRPDGILYLSVLSACGHTGLLDEGRRLFDDLLKKRHGVLAQMEHYGCMVDLLGRAGRLDEALELIRGMPFEPSAVLWRTLLGACLVHKNVEMAEIATREVRRLEPRHHGDSVLLANIYASAGQWGDVARVRTEMRRSGLAKVPGCSMIEVEGRVHSFVVEDESHR